MKGFQHPYGLSLAFLSVAASEVEYKSLDGPEQMFPRASVSEGYPRGVFRKHAGRQFRHMMHSETSGVHLGCPLGVLK